MRLRCLLVGLALAALPAMQGGCGDESGSGPDGDATLVAEHDGVVICVERSSDMALDETIELLTEPSATGPGRTLRPGIDSVAADPVHWTVIVGFDDPWTAGEVSALEAELSSSSDDVLDVVSPSAQCVE